MHLFGFFIINFFVFLFTHTFFNGLVTTKHKAYIFYPKGKPSSMYLKSAVLGFSYDT